MRPNFLIRSLDGGRSRLERISPFLFSQRKLLNRYFLARGRDLPGSGLEFRARTFDFGYNNPAQVLAPYAVINTNLISDNNLLVWGIVGVSNPKGTAAAAVSPAYLFNVTHTHEGTQIQWFNKAISDVEAAGSAQHPYLMREPQLVLAGDSLQIEIQNLGNFNLQAQITLYGGQFS